MEKGLLLGKLSGLFHPLELVSRCSVEAKISRHKLPVNQSRPVAANIKFTVRRMMAELGAIEQV